MGLKCSPDYSQEVMENVFRDITDAEVYIDDIGAFSHSWDDHLQLLRSILTKLQDNGFRINPLKYEWALSETDWLGYWLTPCWGLYNCLDGYSKYLRTFEYVRKIAPS